MGQQTQLVKTGAVRLNNVNLITPLVYQDQETYQTEVLINKKDDKTLSAINAAMDEVAEKESKTYGDFADLDADDIAKLKSDFLKDGVNHQNDAYHETYHLISRNKQQQPSLQEKGKSDQITKSSILYDGVLCRVVFQVGSYRFERDGEIHHGFYAKLLGVQKVKDMDQIDNTLHVNDMFNDDDGGDDLWQ